MLEIFKAHLAAQFGATTRSRLLLALSGGVDSVVLADLLVRGGYNFALAHCNFQLRGKESEMDERFCRRLATRLKVTIYTNRFDVKEKRSETGQSVQMAARELRYRWFADLIEKEGFDFLLTAHHADDVAETMLLNLVRGTGINGMKGIPSSNGKIIRPLLNFTKDELVGFAKQNKLRYRVDSSNSSLKYDRNFIRLKVLPLLKKLNPAFTTTSIKNARRFGEEAWIVNDYLAAKADQLIKRADGYVRINKSLLLGEKSILSMLHYLLSPFGFNETQEANVLQNLLSNTAAGQFYFSPTHELTIDRQELVIRPVPEAAQELLVIHNIQELKELSILKVARVKKFKKPSANELILSASSLQFPLVIRAWQTGDRFRPFGMKGFKLLSDFLKEQKLNLFEKQNCRVLVNGNGEIIWVMGFRSDERYRVSGHEKDLIRIRLG
jgi:tRNA(Ile)-lysidine synthase